MIHTHLKWLSGVLLAGSVLLGAGAAPAQQATGTHVTETPIQTGRVEQSAAASLDVQEAFEAVTKQAFAETFPHGKLSVVQREIFATAAVLTTAHRVALEGQRQRYEYRKAVVYQAASRRALDEERFAVAMYLSLHARAIADGVIRANTTRLPREYQPDDLDLIKRAGGVSASEVVGYLEKAEEDVPAVRLLFVEREKKEARK